MNQFIHKYLSSVGLPFMYCAVLSTANMIGWMLLSTNERVSKDITMAVFMAGSFFQGLLYLSILLAAIYQFKNNMRIKGAISLAIFFGLFFWMMISLDAARVS